MHSEKADLLKHSTCVVTIALIALLSGCELSGTNRSAATTRPDGQGPAAALTATFMCGSTRIEAAFTDGELRIDMDGQSHRLKRAISASGARYVGATASGPAEFWNKGRAATLTVGERTYPPCREAEEADATLDTVYVARGSEPGWLLHADNRQLVLEIDYGATRIEAPAPRVTPRADGFTYTASTDRQDVVVEVRHQSCTAPSGTALRDTVTVRIGSRVLEGCGGGPLTKS